jgi:hypothetical protein
MLWTQFSPHSLIALNTGGDASVGGKCARCTARWCSRARRVAPNKARRGHNNNESVTHYNNEEYNVIQNACPYYAVLLQSVLICLNCSALNNTHKIKYQCARVSILFGVLCAKCLYYGELY